MNIKDLIEVKPDTFAIDDRSGSGLIIFESLKDMKKFSFQVGESVDLALFIDESIKRSESGFCLAYRFIDHFEATPEMGVLKAESNEEDVTALLLLKSQDSDLKLGELKLSILELLGLWSLKQFPLYATKDLIEDQRDTKYNLSETDPPLRRELYKKYGQKYLM